MRNLPNRLVRSTCLRPIASSATRSQSSSTSSSSTTSTSSTAQSTLRPASRSWNSVSSTSTPSNRPRLKDRALETVAHNAEQPLLTAGSPPATFRPRNKPPAPSPQDTHNINEIDLSPFSPNYLPAPPPVDAPPREGRLLREFDGIQAVPEDRGFGQSITSKESKGKEKDSLESRATSSAPKRFEARHRKGPSHRRVPSPADKTAASEPSPKGNVPTERYANPFMRTRPIPSRQTRSLPPRSRMVRSSKGVRPAHSPANVHHSRSIRPTQTGVHNAGSTSPPSRVLQYGDTSLELYKGYLTLSTKQIPRKSFNYAQLREYCACDKCIHPSTRQRTLTLGQIYQEAKESGLLDEDPGQSEKIRQEADDLVIDWGGSQGHTSRYPIRTLRYLARPRSKEVDYLTNVCSRQLWSHAQALPTAKKVVEFSQLFPQGIDGVPDQAALEHVVKNSHIYGFVRIIGVPTDKTDNATCALRKVASAVGPLRNTFYGELWNVRNEPSSKNVAYTDLNLGLHMDLLYHTNPPRFQLLHCLRNRVEGGQSYFVDSFAVARDFAARYPAETNLLSQIPLTFEYDNDGHYMSHYRTIFPKSLSSQHQHAEISWSPPFQGARRGNPPVWAAESTVGLQKSAEIDLNFLKAVALWESYLDDPKYKYEFTMAEGDLAFFDNRRVLHARRAFRDWTDEERAEKAVETVEGEPTRWLKGCYLDGDTVWDRIMSSGKKQSSA